MSFKIVIFAVAVFTFQVNAQMEGIIRPFATGFTNGLNEMAKPFVQFGQSVMSPAAEYLSSNRRPFVSQWMSYPSQIIPQTPASIYEGYEALTSGIPGGNYIQVIRPTPVFKPQTPFYQVPNQPSLVRPARPYPVPAPVPSFPSPPSSSSEESSEIYRPSNLLIKPNPTEIEAPKIEDTVIPDDKFEGATMQRPLPIPEDQE